MKQRILTGIVILLIVCAFLGLRFVNISFFDIMILGISLIGGYEVSNSFTKTGRHNNIFVIIFYAISNFICLRTLFNLNAKISLILMGVFGIFLLSILITLVYSAITIRKLKTNYQNLSSDCKISFKEYFLNEILNTVKVMIYPCTIVNFLYFINNISSISWQNFDGNGIDLGLFLILMVFIVSMVTDTMAFFTGKLLKGPKLAPKTSPNKTISGAVGGLVFAVIASILYFYLFSLNSSYSMFFKDLNLKMTSIVAIAVLGSVFNQIGDLFESHIKRKLGIKDLGYIFPGHGGVMDRIDGLSFVAVVIFVIFSVYLAF